MARGFFFAFLENIANIGTSMSAKQSPAIKDNKKNSITDVENILINQIAASNTAPNLTMFFFSTLSLNFPTISVNMPTPNIDRVPAIPTDKRSFNEMKMNIGQTTNSTIANIPCITIMLESPSSFLQAFLFFCHTLKSVFYLLLLLTAQQIALPTP